MCLSESGCSQHAAQPWLRKISMSLAEGRVETAFRRPSRTKAPDPSGSENWDGSQFTPPTNTNCVNMGSPSPEPSKKKKEPISERRLRKIPLKPVIWSTGDTKGFPYVLTFLQIRGLTKASSTHGEAIVSALLYKSSSGQLQR